MSEPQLPSCRTLVQRRHQLPVVLRHVDVEFLQRRRAVEFSGMRAGQLLQVEVELLVGDLRQLLDVRVELLDQLPVQRDVLGEEQLRRG